MWFFQNNRKKIYYEKILFFIFIFTIFFFYFEGYSEGIDENINIGDKYFPLRVGNYKIFKVTFRQKRNNGDREESVFKRVTTINSIDEIEDLIIITAEVKSEENDITLFIIQRGNKVYGFGAGQINIEDLIDNSEELNFFVPIVLLPVRDGVEEIIEIEDGQTAIYSVEKVFDIEVPAGKFSECLMVTIVGINKDITKTWLYPDVGLIKTEYQSNDGTISVLEELEEYKVIP